MSERTAVDRPRARILTPKLADQEYGQLQEAARMAEMSVHEYTAALIRTALQEDAPGVVIVGDGYPRKPKPGELAALRTKG